jgi:hypothetical protein
MLLGRAVRGLRMEEHFVYECPRHGQVTSLTWAESIRRRVPATCPSCGARLTVHFVSDERRERLR